MEVMAGQEPGDKELIPNSSLLFVLSLWTIFVYTTPSTSELWSCLSFLRVPAMQIRASEVQISICADKEAGQGISRERWGCQEISGLFCKPKKFSSRLEKACLNHVSKRFWLDPFLFWKPNCCLGISIPQKCWGRVSWETNGVGFLLVEREKNGLKGLGDKFCFSLGLMLEMLHSWGPESPENHGKTPAAESHAGSAPFLVTALTNLDAFSSPLYSCLEWNSGKQFCYRESHGSIRPQRAQEVTLELGGLCCKVSAADATSTLALKPH